MTRHGQRFLALASVLAVSFVFTADANAQFGFGVEQSGLTDSTRYAFNTLPSYNARAFGISNLQSPLPYSSQQSFQQPGQLVQPGQLGQPVANRYLVVDPAGPRFGFATPASQQPQNNFRAGNSFAFPAPQPVRAPQAGG